MCQALLLVQGTNGQTPVFTELMLVLVKQGEEPAPR